MVGEIVAIGARVLVIKPGKELRGRTGLALRFRPVDFVGCFAVIPAGVRLHDACIDGKALALDQASVHAGPNHHLEHLSEDVAMPEINDAVGRIAAETGLSHRPSIEGEHVSGTYRQRLTLASGRFAMIDDGLGFQLVLWRPALDQHFGR